MPEFGFVWVAVLIELCGDLIDGGFFDVVLGVAGKFRAGFAGWGPTGPGAPFTLLEPGLSESVGVMLEVNAWIADEGFLGRVLQDVDESLVGERPGA